MTQHKKEVSQKVKDILEKEKPMQKANPDTKLLEEIATLKDQMVRDAIMRTQEQVEEIGKDVKVIDERLFEIQQQQKWKN